jgi:hypothetical protein
MVAVEAKWGALTKVDEREARERPLGRGAAQVHHGVGMARRARRGRVVVVERKAPPSEAAARRVDHAERQHGGGSGVGRVSTCLQHLKGRE